MKRAFIRAVWGSESDDWKSDVFSRNRASLDKELVNAAKDNLLTKDDYIVYVMGENNFSYVESNNFKCKMVCKEGFMHPSKESGVISLPKRTWLNKLEILNSAMMDYDEIIYLDWDCKPTQKIPDDLWDNLSKKREIQAVLVEYKKAKNAPWRPGRWQKKLVCRGAFIYCRDKTAFKTMLSYEYDKQMGTYWLDETYLAWHTDKLMGGWTGTESIGKYFELFEPDCATDRSSILYNRKNQNKIIFKHPL